MEKNETQQPKSPRSAGYQKSKIARMIPIDPDIAQVAAEAAKDLGFSSVSEMTESLLRDVLTESGNL
jgi:hypothetical protein